MLTEHVKNNKDRGYEVSFTLFYGLSRFDAVCGTYHRDRVMTATLVKQRDKNLTKIISIER